MQLYYSATTGGFYAQGLHEEMPEDCVEISNELHAQLLADQANGKRIKPGAGGLPISEDIPAPTADEVILAEIVALEATVTARRLREAQTDDAGGSAAGRAWLRDVNEQIILLRGQLEDNA
jgi:hypothetical protein